MILHDPLTFKAFFLSLSSISLAFPEQSHTYLDFVVPFVFVHVCVSLTYFVVASLSILNFHFSNSKRRSKMCECNQVSEAQQKYIFK